MLSTRSSDLQQKTLLIKQDDKFFSRLLSRELSMNSSTKNGSFRGLPSSVPFTWESQPGTPKHHFHSGTVQPMIPPLTPPPSYYSTPHSPIKKHTSSFRSNPFHTLFLKLNITKSSSSTNHAAAHQPSSPSISSYSSSSWTSSISSSLTPPSSSRRRRTRFGSWGGSSSSSSCKVDEEDSVGIVGSPTSTLCFMIRRRSGSSRRGNIDLQKKGLMSSIGSN